MKVASFADLIEELRKDRDLAAEVIYTASLPPSPEAFGELNPPLPRALVQALESAGAKRLWSHQADGIAAAREGQDVLITTPTASGKSLIFQVPVLEEALEGGDGKALFLFPLKALGQDQKAKLEQLAALAGLDAATAGCEIYDGDTPRTARRKIKANPPRVVVSNPDMLHLSLLGYLGGWEPFLADLSWIVLDELHTYRGIFGSHFHHVLARLQRACRACGSEPRLIASSATAENAGEFASVLARRPFHWVRESGAPREGRHFVLLRPAASPYTATLKLFASLLRAGLKTIVFTKARRITELLYSWLQRQEPELARRVANYRSGFLPGERREIEARLFAGELDGVISTSALEMGIDVGGLDACILVGYPGSIMATWQRAGRVGRAGRESLIAMIAMQDALDQYFLEHPEELLERPCEPLVLDPLNEPVSRGHLVCAAAEIPLDREGDRDYLEPLAPVVGELLREGELREAADRRQIFARRRRPHREISLRGTGATYAVVDEVKGRTVGTVDGARAHHECHPGAVYLHGGRQYLVRELDSTARQALAQGCRLDYFTTPLTEKETEVLEVLAERQDGPLAGRLGRLKVTERVVGYERKQIGSQEVLSRHTLDLEPMEFETVGLWFEAPREMEETVKQHGEDFMGALHAAEHAAISLYPLLALCDRGDIGGISYPVHPQTECGAIFIYDGHPGGVGIAERVFETLPALLAKVLDLLDGCDCEGGCPSCVQSPKCGNGNRPLDKAGAARVLRLLLERENPTAEALVAAELPRTGVEWRPRRSILAQELLADAPPHRTAAAETEGEPGAGGITAVMGEGAQPAGSDEASSSGSEDNGGPRRKRSTPAKKPVRRRGRKAQDESIPEAAALPSGDSVTGPPRTVLFDLETLRSADEVGGWGKAHRMGVAIGVALVLEEGRFETFDESRVGDLVRLLKEADLVIGFNIRGFDYKVLSGYTGEDYGRLLPTLDLLDEVHRKLGFRLSMNALAQETLGAEKSADGLQSLEWVREGRLDLVEEYCRRDVEILRDLYLHGRRECFLLFRDKKGRQQRIAVDW